MYKSITSDDAINAAPFSAALTLSGSTSGVEAGQTVTVTFGGKTYTLFLIQSSEPTKLRRTWYAASCLKKKNRH
ncbi:hypothetical protein [Escherichia coli]|uniref:hypothetical protein n=1 Tax=Escherichia coli TaxID=562 RepID=UPI001161247A|nr:hypothetical protein [Escherichia coli]